MEERGFVFAPYDDLSDPILFPLDEAELYKEEFKEIEINSDATLPFNDEGKQHHIQLVEKAIEEIKSTDLRKIVVSRAEVLEASEFQVEQIFRRLLSKYQNAFVYCWYHPEVGLWMGASPETLCKVNSGRLVSIALAGTQPHIDGQQVNWGTKEIEEQQMVADYIIEAIQGKVDNVSIGEVHTVRAGDLLHLKTRIEGDINPKSTLRDIVSELHPTPAVCGLPKELAQSFLANQEGYDRKFYTGFLGELNYDVGGDKDASHFFVNLRCMEYDHDKIFIYVGGGITADSIAEKEWEETLNKTLTIKSVL